MIKLALPLVLSLATAGAFACPDGMKSMDAKAPAGQKMAINEQPVWTQARGEVTKATPGKAAAKPAVTTAVTTEAKKAPGV